MGTIERERNRHLKKAAKLLDQAYLELARASVHCDTYDMAILKGDTAKVLITLTQYNIIHIV